MSRRTCIILVVALCFGLLISCNSGSSEVAPLLNSEKETDSFQEPVYFTTSSPGLDMQVEDYDGDGKPDIILPLLGGRAAIMKNISQDHVEFDQVNFTEGEGQIMALHAADIDQDGLNDMGVLRNSGLIELWQQAAPGSFSLMGSYPAADSDVFVFDYLNTDDEIPDILLASNRYRNLASGWLDSSFGLQPAGNIIEVVPGWPGEPDDSFFVQIISSDIDSNGRNDIILLDKHNDQAQFYLGDDSDWDPSSANIDYTRTTNYDTCSCDLDMPGRPIRAGAGDLNNDGKSDLAVVYEQPAGREFDFPMKDEDGTLLGGVTDTYYWIAVFENDMVNGTTMQPVKLVKRTALYFPGHTQDITIAEATNDQYLDIVLCSETSRDGGVSSMVVWPNLGNFTFGNPVMYAIDSSPLRIVSADFNADDRTDIVVLMPMINVLAVFEGDPTGQSSYQGVVCAVIEVEE